MSRHSPEPPRQERLRDIIFLLADGAMADMVSGFFCRTHFAQAIGCEPFEFDPVLDIFVMPTKDPGVYREAREFLRTFENSHRRAVVMLDNDWDGSPGVERIQAKLVKDLTEAWCEYAIIVIDPELEAWVWQDNPNVAEALKCPKDFRDILAASGHWPRDLLKPPDPKAALQHLRKRYRADPSNAAFRRLAAKVSVKDCQDAAFVTLRTHLRTWFPKI